MQQSKRFTLLASLSHTGMPYPTAAQNAANHDPVSAALFSLRKASQNGNRTGPRDRIGNWFFCRNNLSKLVLSEHSFVSPLQKHTYPSGPVSTGLQ